MRVIKTITILVLRSDLSSAVPKGRRVELLRRVALVLALCLIVSPANLASAATLGTAFTYQGRLIEANKPADGLYDFQFKLFDNPNVILGSQVGTDVNKPDVNVIDGYFTVELDFGSDVFDGNDRWLEIGVRPGDQNDPCAYTVLEPRQEVTPTPYALYAKTAGSGSGDNLGNHTATQNIKLNGYWLSGDGGSKGVYVTNAGKVGIGTATPNNLLQVSGLINFDSHSNIFLGSGVGQFNTTGYDNTAVGVIALSSNTTGYSNTAMGIRALSVNITGYSNTAVGDSAISDVGAGHNNTAVGFRALQNSPANYNTAVGSNALQGIYSSNGYGNTAIGFQAGDNITIGARNIIIGYDIDSPNSGTNSCQLNIGNLIFGQNLDGTGTTISTGNIGIGCTDPSEKLDVDGTARLRGIGSSSGTTVVADGNGKLWKSSSSRRYKENIRSLEGDPNMVLQLRPVRFQWKTNSQQDIGLIAEEVEQQLNDLVIYDNEGRPEAVKYDKVSLYLLAVVKDLKAENESLKQRLTSLETTVQQLTKGKEFEP